MKRSRLKRNDVNDKNYTGQLENGAKFYLSTSERFFQQMVFACLADFRSYRFRADTELAANANFGAAYFGAIYRTGRIDD